MKNVTGSSFSFTERYQRGPRKKILDNRMLQQFVVQNLAKRPYGPLMHNGSLPSLSPSLTCTILLLGVLLKMGFFLFVPHIFLNGITNMEGNSVLQMEWVKPIFNPIWCKIWNLSCLAKVTSFIWWTLHDTLPCRVTLANRHMKVSSICPYCASGLEDTKHLLFQYATKLRWSGED